MAEERQKGDGNLRQEITLPMMNEFKVGPAQPRCAGIRGTGNLRR
jgi:hypothetical protein